MVLVPLGGPQDAEARVVTSVAIERGPVSAAAGCPNSRSSCEITLSLLFSCSIMWIRWLRVSSEAQW